jgi:hypothetical protein
LARIDTPRRNGEKQENKVSQSVGFSVCWERVDKRIKKRKQESRPTNSSIKHYTWEWEGGRIDKGERVEIERRSRITKTSLPILYISSHEKKNYFPYLFKT